jgi:hypothetical protein
VRVYQFRHFGSVGKNVKDSWCRQSRPGRYRSQFSNYFFGDFFAVGLATGDADAEGAADGDACGLGATDGVGTGASSGMPDCRTECVPVTAGSESIKAINMKAAAAPIVIFESKVCVPRGPNAVLETELENSAPASDLPGCKSIVTTRMTHARIKSP